MTTQTELIYETLFTIVHVAFFATNHNFKVPCAELSEMAALPARRPARPLAEILTGKMTNLAGNMAAQNDEMGAKSDGA